MFTSHISACSTVDVAASSHSHLPSFISNHLPSHQIVFPYPTSLKPRRAKRTNRAYFYSLNVWPHCSGRLCNCSAALACLDSWKPCDWSGNRPTLGQTWTLTGGAQKYFHMCGTRTACGGGGALNSRTTCFKTLISGWCVQAHVEYTCSQVWGSPPQCESGWWPGWRPAHHQVLWRWRWLHTLRTEGDFRIKTKELTWKLYLLVVNIFKFAVLYQWCHYPFSPSPGWRRTGTLLPSPRWGWRAKIWAERSHLPHQVHLRGSSWGKRWWSRAHLASCPSGRWREELWEEGDWLVQYKILGLAPCIRFNLGFRVYSAAVRSLTNVTFLAQSINIRGRLWFKQLGVFPAFLSTG